MIDSAAQLLALLFDATLIGLLLLLALMSVMTQSLFNSVVLMICFGLVMALAWVRLQAPDIALAEAALGAGVTGALLFSAIARLQGGSVLEQPLTVFNTVSRWRKAVLIIGTLLLGLMGVTLLLTLLTLPVQPGPLMPLVEAHLEQSGVNNPVTAVLINFRGYDTLLEMAVLFLALLGNWLLSPLAQTSGGEASPFLRSLLTLSMPLLVLSAFYLLWAGASYPGGAFQAGAVLAGAGVLLLLSHTLRQVNLQRWYWRFGVTLGLLVFIATALGMIVANGQFLQLTSPARQIFLIELAAMFSIAAVLTGLMSFGQSTDEDVT